MDRKKYFRITLLTIAFLALLLAPKKGFAAEPVVAPPRYYTTLIQKVVVFPFKSEQSLAIGTEQAWWKTREILTSKRRFFVASKNFLTQKEAFQPRGSLTAQEAVLLGGLLEADAILTGETVGRSFNLHAYDGKTGRLLFDKRMNFHPSLRSNDQIQVVAERLVQDFISSLPYQAFITIDPLEGKPIYFKNDKSLAVIDSGSGVELKTGSEVQVVKLKDSDPSKPLLQNGLEMEVMAIGKVIEVREGVAEIAFTRGKDITAIKEKSFVRVPVEAQRLAEEYALPEERPRMINEEVPALLNPDSEHSQSARKTSTWITGVLGVLGVVLFAL